MENPREITSDKRSTTTAIEEAAARLRLPLTSNNTNKKFKKIQKQQQQSPITTTTTASSISNNNILNNTMSNRLNTMSNGNGLYVMSNGLYTMNHHLMSNAMSNNNVYEFDKFKKHISVMLNNDFDLKSIENEFSSNRDHIQQLYLKQDLAPNDLILTMIKSIKELGLYDSFKYAFLENSRKFFHEKSQSYRPLIENRNIGTYLKLIKQQIEFEIDKVTYFFGEELYIKESSVKIMINEYYLRHMDIIIKKDKPYFMKHYKKKFAKRLLYHHDDKNFNLSNEEWILSLFNRANIIGDDLYLDNLYGMIKDIHESIGIKKDFDIFNHLKVTILTGSYWPKFITGPSPEVADLKIPYELFLMRKSFQDYFYCKRRDGANRNLKWLHSYDNLIISLIHPKGKMYFSINMCMFIILEMFNYTRSYQISYTIREIMKNTELVLKSALSSLIFGEIKLLNKFVNSKRLNLSDAIFINENLNFIESTVDNPIIIDERKSQRQISTSEDVQISSYNISNEIRIDSRIMKLMKLHKRYQHNSLISFIQKDFKNNFHQQVQIKSLIKRQFLRNEGKNVVYVP
ncbi:2283_t:CDS:10 [Entrophospora sp. SA101]|nr:1674_t:CDS:10 [Entrophospora sp. SA101]CAJ0847983.1 2283_t:CDS:10 [Entrophospora sp. SA101]